MFTRFCFIALASLTILTACQPATNSAHTITVQADAQTYQEPDRARISLNMSQNGDDLPALKAQVDEQTAQVIEFLLNQDIPKQAITSYRVSAMPVYDYKDGQRIQRGFTVSRTIQVELSDLTKYDIILNQALTSGVTEINQANFVVSQPEVHYRAVLEQAVRNAHEKAELLAAAAGVKLDTVVQLQELSQAPKASSIEMMSFRQGDSASMAGLETIRAQVQITYSIAN